LLSRLLALSGLSIEASMRFLILGATGNTGRELVELGLARGHALTAFVRSPEKLGTPPPRLSVVRGDPLDSLQLAAALPGHDAILSALGPPPRDGFRPSTLLTRAGESTLTAMHKTGVQRLVVLSAAILFREAGFYVALFRWLLRHHARDLSAMEASVQASTFDWTIARPPRLVRSGASGYRICSHQLPKHSRVMSFRGVAEFMLDSAEQHAHVREIVGLGPAPRSGA
jgi:putative NADH-flavin reductase